MHENRRSDCEDTERVMEVAKTRWKTETEGERVSRGGIKKTTAEEARRLCG